MSELKSIGNKSRAIEIYNIIKEELKKESKSIGYKVWGNPADSDNNETYEYSKRFTTRLYENDDIIEVRNYGRFTIGRRSLKREVFFNYLREEGLDL